MKLSLKVNFHPIPQITPLTEESDIRANVRLLLELEAVWIAENDLGEGSTASGVVDDLLDNTASVTVTLSVIECSEFGRVLYRASETVSTLEIRGIGLLVRKTCLPQPGVGSCRAGR